MTARSWKLQGPTRPHNQHELLLLSSSPNHCYLQ